MKTRLSRFLSGFLIVAYLSSAALTGVVHANSTQTGKEQAQVTKREPKRGVNPETGKVSFIGGGDPITVKAPGVRSLKDLSLQERGLAIANAYGREFGLSNPVQELKLRKSEKDSTGKDILRYQQIYKGIPVLSGEMIVNMNSNGDLLSISGEVSSDLILDTKPAVKAEEARKTALAEVARVHQIDETQLQSSDPELWIFDESILVASARPVELVWRMAVTPKDTVLPIREMVLVNAQTGELSFHINQVDTGDARHKTPQPVAGKQRSRPLTAASQIQYVDLVVDEARGKLYGADKAGNKVDVIDMVDMSLITSYRLVSGALPNGIELSPDGNELAVAQSGSGRVAFISLTDGTISEMSSALSGSSTKATDIVYGRPGILYALSTQGLHVIDLTVTPHVEVTTQYVSGGSYEERLGAISSDKNTLYYVTGTCCSGDNKLYKFDVSAGLSKPVQLVFAYLYRSGFKTNIRLSLADDATLLTAWGSVYNTSTLTLKAKNGQSLLPVIALPGRNFYVVAYDDPSNQDSLYFFDKESSHQLSSLDTGISGTPGALAITNDGNTLFVSSTGGMAKFEIGTTPPGTIVNPPASLHQYRDLVFDMPRGMIYGTDASGRIDVLDQNTGNVLNSYLLPNGSNPMGIDLSPDGSELAVALNGLEAILFMNPETGAEIARVKPLTNDESDLPYDVIYGRSGRLYADGNPGSYGFDYLHVIDTLTHSWLGKSSFMVRDGAELSITSDYRYIYANDLGFPEEIYVFDAQADIPVKLYDESILGTTFAIALDGSKVFTNDGQVWSRDIQEQMGTLQNGTGNLIKYIPGKNAVGLTVGNAIQFFDVNGYQLITTYTSSFTGDILEMAVSPDGSKLIVNFSGGNILLLDTSTVLPAPPSTPVPSTIKYEDVVVDEARGKLYGADKDGNKIDVINASDLSVVSSFSLPYSAWPTALDLSPDGNELAVAQSGLTRIAFINLNDGTISETALHGVVTARGSDVLYGRAGILYVISSSGIHVIDTNTHNEDTTQYVTVGAKFGAITPDKNTLLTISSSASTASTILKKFDVSAEVTQPVLLGSTYLYNSGFVKDTRLNLFDDNTLLTSWGSIYNVSTLKLKAKNGQSLSPVVALPGHGFYAVAANNTASPDTLYFHDGQSSHKLSSLNTGVMGTPGAMAVTRDGNTLFVSSTGGMTKFSIGSALPGTAISLPQSQKQYRDFAFDMPRGMIYGADASGRIDVIDQDTGVVINSYLLPNGANPIGIDLNPDGSELAIALNGLEAILFMDPETGTEIARGFPQGDAVYQNVLPYDVIYGRAGRLYSNGMDRIQVFDSVTHNLLVAKSLSSTGEMILTADKKYIYNNDPGGHERVYDVRTDNVTVLYEKAYISATQHAIIPDGSKVFTVGGQVWNGTLDEQLGLVEGGAGTLIEYIPGQDALVLAAQDSNGSMLKFVSASTHRLLTTYRPANSNNIVEMEISPDGSKLILGFSNSDIFVLDISTILPVPPIPPTPGPATVKYEDLVVDEARGKLYGVDKTDSTIDVINMTDLSVESSYLLIYGALPTGIDLSPDGNELAIAQSGLSRVAFINLNDGTISYTPSKLSGSSTKGYDVLYGRTGILYVLSTKGIHVLNTAVTPHVEDTAQLAVIDTVEKFGALTSDKNTLFFVSGSDSTGYSEVGKFNVSAGLTKPVQLSFTYLYDSDFTRNIRLSLADDTTLLTSWGSIYDPSTLTPKAKNGESLFPVIGLPGRSFYAVAHDNASGSDAFYFFDEQSSHKLSVLSTDVEGVLGAIATTSNGNTLFVSSTGGMAKFEIGTTPPGTALPLPQSQKQYRDFAFDMPRGVIYGTDASGRIDVIDQDTGTVLNSYLLPNGANPIGIDLSPDGSELAIALNGLEAILFMNPQTGAEIARVTPQLSISVYYDNLPYDVIYGRTGRLYSDGSPGYSGIDYIHVFDTSTHTWLAKSNYSFRMGADLSITSDRRYLYANETLNPNDLLVLDAGTDTLTKLFEAPYGAISVSRFTIMPDGSKVFTSEGQVWSGNVQARLGTLEGGSGTLIKFIPNKNMLAFTRGNAIRFMDAANYRLIWTHVPNYFGAIQELEVAPDGSKLIANYPGGIIYILDLTDFPPTPPPPTPVTPGPPSSTGGRRTYTASGQYTLPGTLLCDQDQLVCTNGANVDADNAHRYAADTLVFYNTHHGRNSFDNQGGTIDSTVDFGTGYQNAFWDGYQLVFGDDMAADDVVAHEFTHGVTQYTSDLIYAYQSGAINESFSDVWGEFIDQTNNSGDDSASAKWWIGEDSALGSIRNMSDPTFFGDPDKMSSPYYYAGSDDNGGVHFNSGVNNKAAYLMVEGSTFNGRTISGIGLNKTAAVYYEVQVYHLTMGANYSDLYYALIQGCLNLIGGSTGITQYDCEQVRLAAEAVEMVPVPPPAVISIVRASADPNSTASVDFTVSFSKPVIGIETTAPFSDFTLTTTAITGASITSISGSGATRTVTVNTGSGNGTLRLDVPVNATITDLDGKPLSNLPFRSSEVYTFDRAPGAGIYDDADYYWSYSGTWTPVSGVTGPYAGTHRYTSTVGNYAEFKFNGAKFKFTYVKAPNRGLIDIYVDGIKVGQVNAYSGSLSWQAAWTSPVLTAGVHTVRFVHAGGHPYIDIDAIQVVDAAPAMGPGVYDDMHTAWTFSSGWTIYNGAGPANATNHYTNVVGSEAQITIDGTKFVLTYVKASNRGLIDVYVDGSKIAQINAKGTSTLWQQTWPSPVLTAGIHTVRFVHAGASGTYIDVDKIQILGSSPSDTLAPAAIGDLRADTGTATGSVDLSWTAPGDDNLTGTAASYLVRYSTSAINSLDAWNAATPVTAGLPTPAVSGTTQTMTVAGLVPGTTYSFAVRAQDEESNLGGISNSPSAAAQSPSAVPAGIYDDTDVNWAYTGTWTPYTGSGPANGTSHYASTAGSEAQITFEGVKFKFTYLKASNRGLIDVYVDGTKVTTINARSTSTTWQQTWTSPDLPPGLHTVRFVHAGGGTYIDVDTIQILETASTVTSGSYDDGEAAWTFGSGWTAYTGAGPANNTNHYTNVVGSDAQLTFTGTGFTLTYVKASNRGLIDVYVDGTKVGQINARSVSLAWQQTWTSPPLSPGTHTVRFVHTGGGTYIDVDAITILP